MDFFLQLLISGAMLGSVYALIAMGIVLIYKATSIFNFSQAGLFVLGAYISWAFLSISWLPLWASIILTFLSAAVVGILLERLFMRPLIGLPILAPIIVTLSLLSLLRGVTYLLFGGEGHRYPTGIFPVGTWQLGGIMISQVQFLAFSVAFMVIILFAFYFRYTRSGLAMRVTAEDHNIAQSLGIDVKGVFRSAWIIAGIVAFIGGILLGTIQGIDHSLEEVGLKAFAVLLLGGLESISGTVVAGIIIGVLETLTQGYLSSYLGGGIGDVFPYFILIIVLLIRPSGLFGLARIERI
jgi:branched-chain amino acid transport system permease protein